MSAITDTLTEEVTEKLRQARSNMILGHVFFGSLIMKLPEVPDPSCKTLWTDGVSLGFNPQHVLDLPMFELEASLAHEVLHVASGHVWRRDGRDPDRWNIAADYVVNLILKDAGFKLGKDWYLDERYRDLSTEAVYDMLPPSQGGGKPKAGGTGNGAGQSAGGETSGQGQQQSQGGGPPKGKPSPRQASAQAAGPGEVRDLPDPAQAAEAEAEWKMATQQATLVAKKRGHLPGSLVWAVEEAARSKTDWRSILHRFVQQAARADYDWRMPNSRYAHVGFYLPSLRSETMGPMVIGVDTSGSTNSWMEAFFAELKCAVEEARPEHVHVVYVDAHVQRVDEYGPDDQMQLRPKGGGGTDFRPFFEWIEENEITPACVVYLTDLAGTFPDSAPDYPTLWACPIDGQAPFGEVVHVEL